MSDQPTGIREDDLGSWLFVRRLILQTGDALYRNLGLRQGGPAWESHFSESGPGTASSPVLAMAPTCSPIVYPPGWRARASADPGATCPTVSIDQIPSIWSYEATTSWLVEDLIPEGAITLLSGTQGSARAHWRSRWRALYLMEGGFWRGVHRSAEFCI